MRLEYQNNPWHNYSSKESGHNVLKKEHAKLNRKLNYEQNTEKRETLCEPIRIEVDDINLI